MPIKEMVAAIIYALVIGVCGLIVQEWLIWKNDKRKERKHGSS